MIADWADEDVAGFETRILRLRHTLHQRPLFTDEGLARILDLYPREALGAFTMGEDLEDWGSWRTRTMLFSNPEMASSVQSAIMAPFSLSMVMFRPPASRRRPGG